MGEDVIEDSPFAVGEGRVALDLELALKVRVRQGELEGILRELDSGLCRARSAPIFCIYWGHAVTRGGVL